ncbi:MAG: hypothetical protein C5B52_17770 [Bacteroidetes bacterium]|nr:MAG: hypothetical protein C5B52_17770 [Bacteroidota bacterium]
MLNAKSQTTLGNQQVMQFDIGGGTKVWGLLYVPPADPANPTETFPLVIFNHGSGEIGSTQADLSKLIRWGTPWLISTGNKMEFIDPRTGVKRRFMSLALQASSWSPRISWTKYVTQNLLFKAPYRVDRNEVYVTGLSAGGDETLQYVTTDGYAQDIAATVPMSPAGGPFTNVVVPVALGIRSWGFAGTAGDNPYLGTLTDFTNSLNSAAPGYARMTTYNCGHGCWNDHYNPSYRETIDGKSMNIYEWMLYNAKLSLLAVDIISAVVQHFTDYDKISWSGKEDLTTDYYEVQVSEDGKAWNTVQTVQSHEEVGTFDYTINYSW